MILPSFEFAKLTHKVAALAEFDLKCTGLSKNLEGSA